MSCPVRRVIPDRRHVIPDQQFVIPAPDQVRGSNIRDPVTSPPIGYLQHTGFRLSPE